MNIFAWDSPPCAAEIVNAPARHLVIVLPEQKCPDWSDHPMLQAALSCVQFVGVNVLADVLPDKTLWLMPRHCAGKLYEYFGERTIDWQTDPVHQDDVLSEKIWLRQPEQRQNPTNVLIIGAGIAGAAMAHELARRGVQATVLEASNTPAGAASGHWQGLLYAKISPHATTQTELLLCGYGYSRRLLEQQLCESDAWGKTGVLHINHDAAETKRNMQLAQHDWHRHLYRAVSAEQASELAGVLVEKSGLFWQQGVWLNPRTWVWALLQHSLIDLNLNQRVIDAKWCDDRWHVQTENAQFSGSHIVFCGGASSVDLPIIQQFPFQLIRGQTSVAAETVAGSLKVALSGASYVAPAWKGWHCFGATFVPNDDDDAWRLDDESTNQQSLKNLNDQLYQSVDFSGSLKGHAAVRCDTHDHLPAVGALGDPIMMRQVYAKLALDKNYRLDTPCPFYPNAFVNTGHGSRGLATAPICAAQVAAMICGEPFVLSRNLQRALNPNRLIIRQIIRQYS